MITGITKLLNLIPNKDVAIDFSKIVDGWGGLFFDDLARSFENTDWEWVQQQFNNIRNGHNWDETSIALSQESESVSILNIEVLDIQEIPTIVFTWSTCSNHHVQIYLSVDPNRTLIINHHVIGDDESKYFYPAVSDCFEMAKQKSLKFH